MPRIRWWPVVAIVVLAACVGLGFIVTGTDWLTSADRNISDTLHALDSGWVAGLASAVAIVLSPACGVAAIVVWTCGLLLRGRRLAAASTFATLCVGWGCALVVKHVVDRPRPPFGVADGPSYPSGHTALATALVFATFFLARRTDWRDTIATGGGLLIVLVMFSRVMYGAHYLTDTVGGVLAASGAIVLLCGFWRLWMPAVVRRFPSLVGAGESVSTPARSPRKGSTPVAVDAAPPTDPAPWSRESPAADGGHAASTPPS